MFLLSDHRDVCPCLPREMLLRHVVQPESLTQAQGEQVVEHIATCPHCAELYEALTEADAELWDEAAQAAGLPPRERIFTHSAKEDFALLWQRIQEEEARQNQFQHRVAVYRFGRFAAALAACVALVLTGGWLWSLMSHPSSSGSTLNQASIVMLGGLGGESQALALGQTVTTQEQRRELLLGGMHRVVLNHDTTVTVQQDPAKSQKGAIAYALMLRHGEVYVEVVPGHPFTVMTPGARLDITGTKFDVKAYADQTELTLLKGGIQFSALDHPNQTMKVTAGQVSMVVGRSAPTSPRVVDAWSVTAWAREANQEPSKVARIASPTSMEGLEGWDGREGAAQAALPDVDTLAYVPWRDAHEDWAVRQFPWVPQVRQTLASQGVTADWIDVLVYSGDLWQFHFDPQKSAGQPLTRLESSSLVRLARYYKVDEAVVLRSVGLFPALAQEDAPAATTPPAQAYREALGRWREALLTADSGKPERDRDLMLFSLQAGEYLANTRTAVYLWAKAHPQEAWQIAANLEGDLFPLPRPPQNEDEFIQQLRQQAMAARACQQEAMEWFVVVPPTLVNGCQPQTLLERRNKLAALVAERLSASTQAPKR